MRTVVCLVLLVSACCCAVATDDWRERYAELLQKKIDLKYEGTTLADFARALSEASGVSIATEPDLKPDGMRLPDLSINGAKPETLLTLACRLSKGRDEAVIEWAVINHAVLVAPSYYLRRASGPGVRSRMTAEFLPELDPLLDRPVTAAFAKMSVEEVLRELKQQTGADSAADPYCFEGRHPLTPLFARQMPLKGVLVWLARLWNCAVVEKEGTFWFTSPEGHLEPTSEIGPHFLPRPPIPGGDNKVSFEFGDTPLADALAVLAPHSELPLIVADEALKARTNLTINLALADAPLQDALDYAVSLLGLTYTVQDDAIIVTTYEDAYRRQPRILKTYEVTDLVGRGLRDIDSVVKALVMPSCWDDGTGSSASLEQGQLVVVQIAIGHEMIEELLASLRE